jgi:GT2 family glycosyltransferase
MRIAIILTTFLRDELMYRIVNSIYDNWNKEYVLLIANQSYQTNEEKIKSTHKFMKRCSGKGLETHYYNLPYDCGLSYARNYLFKKAKELNCEYCFLTADSYEFQKYNLNPIIEFLESNEKNGLVGFIELNKIDPKWCWDLELVPNKSFIISKPTRPIIEFKGYKYQPCDIVQNFYLAKTKMVIEVPHDNELKLCEHEDIMYRFKQAGWNVYFNDSIKCNYIKIKPEAYNEMRRRIYKEYKQKLMKKYNLSGWIRRG